MQRRKTNVVRPNFSETEMRESEDQGKRKRSGPRKEGRTFTASVHLNIRESPSRAAAIVATVDPGTVLPVVSALPGGWIEVAYEGVNRFCLSGDGRYGILE